MEIISFPSKIIVMPVLHSWTWHDYFNFMLGYRPTVQIAKLDNAQSRC